MSYIILAVDPSQTTKIPVNTSFIETLALDAATKDLYAYYRDGWCKVCINLEGDGTSKISDSKFKTICRAIGFNLLMDAIPNMNITNPASQENDWTDVTDLDFEGMEKEFDAMDKDFREFDAIIDDLAR